MDNQQATREHCVYAFQVLQAALAKQQTPAYTLPDFSCPLFVTFNKNGDLRGCIGTFQSAPLSKQLAKFTLTSAFQDDRFPAINAGELPSLEVAVSLLVNFEKGKKWDQWEVGKHGIIINFAVNNREYQATFLPEVAKEQEWDVKTTIKHLVSKAGYRKGYENVLEIIELTTYESSKFNLHFKDL